MEGRNTVRGKTHVQSISVHSSHIINMLIVCSSILLWKKNTLALN